MVLTGENVYDAIPLARYLDHAGRLPSSPNHVMEEPAVLAEIGDPSGRRVLDLGCGDGQFGVQLLAAGCASYRGVDGSTAMVERAQANLVDTGALIELADLEDFAFRPDFADLVTARLSLHYLAELDPVLASVARSLSPGGLFVMTVVHPMLTAPLTVPDGPRESWTVDAYFQAGPRQRPWFGSTVTWYHRTVEQYVDAVLAAGLELRAVRECEPVPDRFDGDQAEFERRSRVPSFLLISARRPVR